VGHLCLPGGAVLFCRNRRPLGHDSDIYIYIYVHTDVSVSLCARLYICVYLDSSDVSVDHVRVPGGAVLF